MSEYWKSIPKYWCKFCKDYFKDTKFEKQQHESTPRHQGNIQRSLRTLHKEKEQEDRQKQRAKDEVARLNGVVGGKSAASTSTTATSTSTFKKEAPRQATAEERKKQIQQLADMGVAVPEEFRREMAIAGDWQTVSVTPVVQEDFSSKPDGMAFGVRKRKMEEEAEEAAAEEAAAIKQKQWGSKFRTYPGKKSRVDDVEYFDALLGGIVTKREPKIEGEIGGAEGNGEETSAPPITDGEVPVKKEDPIEDETAINKIAPPVPDTSIKPEAEANPEEQMPGAGIIFKKRKPKVLKKT